MYNRPIYIMRIIIRTNKAIALVILMRVQVVILKLKKAVVFNIDEVQLKWTTYC